MKIKMKKHEMSLSEKKLLLSIIPEQPKLPYDLEDWIGSDGIIYQKYVIPDDKRQEVLDNTFPFMPVPKIDEARTDLHTEKDFIVKDYAIIRYAYRNIVVSPYFNENGGMSVDWVGIGKSVNVMELNDKCTCEFIEVEVEYE